MINPTAPPALLHSPALALQQNEASALKEHEALALKQNEASALKQNEAPALKNNGAPALKQNGALALKHNGALALKQNAGQGRRGQDGGCRMLWLSAADEHHRRGCVPNDARRKHGRRRHAGLLREVVE